MPANEAIKQRRLELGLTDVEVYKTVGLSPFEYFDIELHEDELLTVTSLAMLKKLCDVLRCSPLAVLGVACAFCDSGSLFNLDYLLPRDQLVRQKREEKGLSIDALAETLGFFRQAVVEMEAQEAFLESWSVDSITDLSREIDVPLQILLKCKCVKCGR